MKWRWKSIKQFFNFYPSEKRGVLILMGTLFIVLIFLRYFDNNLSNSSKIHFYEEIELFHDYHFDTLPCISLRQELDSSDFNNRGFDKYWVDKILKEQSKYGRFNCEEDLLDIKGISINQWILFKESLSPDAYECEWLNLNKANEKEIAKFFRININKAKTFVKYRKSIGGFVKFEQINQIYGFPKKRLNEKRRSRIRLNSTFIEKFDLKKANYRNLLKHGMISRKSASRLNKLRKTKALTIKDIKMELNDFNKPLVSYYFKE